MAEDTHAIDDIRAGVGDLHSCALFLKHLQVGEGAEQLEVMLVDAPWQEARMTFDVIWISRGQGQLEGRAGNGHLLDKPIAEMAQLRRLELVLLEILDIEIMVGAVEVSQGAVTVVSPAIRFAAEKQDSLAISGGPDEGGKVLRQGGQCQVIDQPVAFVVPCLRVEAKKYRGKGRENSAQIKHQKMLAAGC